MSSNGFKLENGILYITRSVWCNNNDQYLLRTSYTPGRFRGVTCGNILIFIFIITQ